MILFLDFDGVLHPMNRATGVFSLLPHFEQVMRDYPGVDIVVSSTWRETYSIEELRSVFPKISGAAWSMSRLSSRPLANHMCVKSRYCLG